MSCSVCYLQGPTTCHCAESGCTGGVHVPCVTYSKNPKLVSALEWNDADKSPLVYCIKHSEGIPPTEVGKMPFSV